MLAQYCGALADIRKLWGLDAAPAAPAAPAASTTASAREQPWITPAIAEQMRAAMRPIAEAAWRDYHRNQPKPRPGRAPAQRPKKRADATLDDRARPWPQRERSLPWLSPLSRRPRVPDSAPQDLDDPAI
jgi:hypothetical protein